jgi:hypothetical protein
VWACGSRRRKTTDRSTNRCTGAKHTLLNDATHGSRQRFGSKGAAQSARVAAAALAPSGYIILVRPGIHRRLVAHTPQPGGLFPVGWREQPP